MRGDENGSEVKSAKLYSQDDSKTALLNYHSYVCK